MSIQAPIVYVNPNLTPPGFGEFLRKVFHSLGNEIQLVINTFYQYDPKPKYNALGSDDVFTVIERTWLGLFNNAIIRAFPKSVTMQEFNVWDERKAIGRCDFL